MTDTTTSTVDDDRIEAKQGYHHGDLRGALLAATKVLVGKRGPDNFTMADACQLAGVSRAAPYRHFKNRDDLLMALVESGFSSLENHLHDIVASSGPPGSSERIADIGMGYVRFAETEPTLFKLMFSNNFALTEQAGVGDERIGSDLEHNASADTDALEKGVPCAGDKPYPKCFSLLIDEIQIHTGSRDERHILSFAVPLWTLVHGAAMLSIDQKYQRVHQKIDIDEMIRSSCEKLLST